MEVDGKSCPRRGVGRVNPVLGVHSKPGCSLCETQTNEASGNVGLFTHLLLPQQRTFLNSYSSAITSRSMSQTPSAPCQHKPDGAARTEEPGGGKGLLALLGEETAWFWRTMLQKQGEGKSPMADCLHKQDSAIAPQKLVWPFTHLLPQENACY